MQLEMKSQKENGAEFFSKEKKLSKNFNEEINVSGHITFKEPKKKEKNRISFHHAS